MLFLSGAEFINSIRTRQPYAWLQLTRAFEIQKRAFDGENDLVITIPPVFASQYEEMFNQKLTTVRSNEGIRVSRNFDFVITPVLVKTLFANVVDGISKEIDNGLNRVRKGYSRHIVVRYIFLIGGFSDCKFVQESIRNIESTKESTILTPQEASVCVLRGAVLYGQNPSFIQSRILRHTYAILSERPYEEGTDVASRMEKVSGKYVVRYLDAIIKKGEAVSEGTIKTRRVMIPKSDQYTKKDIYISEKTNVDNPSSTSVRRLGSLSVERSAATRRDKDKYVDIQFVFGKTEFYASTSDNSATVVYEHETTAGNEDAGINIETAEQKRCIVQ